MLEVRREGRDPFNKASKGHYPVNLHGGRCPSPDITSATWVDQDIQADDSGTLTFREDLREAVGVPGNGPDPDGARESARRRGRRQARRREQAQEQQQHEQALARQASWLLPRRVASQRCDRDGHLATAVGAANPPSAPRLFCLMTDTRALRSRSISSSRVAASSRVTRNPSTLRMPVSWLR